MKLYIRLLLLSLFLSYLYPASKKRFTDRQVAAMIPKYFDRDHNSPNIKRIRIYGKDEQKYLHLEIDVNRNRYLGELDYTLSAMANITQYAKYPFDVFIVVMQPVVRSEEPEALRSNAKCTIDYFIHKRISRKRWSEKCTTISSDLETFVTPSTVPSDPVKMPAKDPDKNNMLKLILFVVVCAGCIGLLVKRSAK